MSESQGAPDGGPFPDPRTAFLLTVATFFATAFISVFFLGLGAVVAIGVGQALAVGTIATLAAKRIPEPQADRIGLRGLDPRSLPVVLCLVPAVLIASELDNYAVDWSPTQAQESDLTTTEGWSEEIYTDLSESSPASGEEAMGTPSAADGDEQDAPEEFSPEELALEELRVDLEDPWTIAQAFVIAVGITPVVEEFFFRGVLQQGLVARLGLARGVGFVAVLYALPHLPAVATIPRFIAGVVSAVGIGALLGLVRVATGSILGSILLASLSAAVGIFSFAVRERIPLPGMNVEGTHLPVTVALASLLIVGWATRTIYQQAVERYAAEHDEPPAP